jgi:hypothetical protein
MRSAELRNVRPRKRSGRLLILGITAPCEIFSISQVRTLATVIRHTGLALPSKRERRDFLVRY